MKVLAKLEYLENLEALANPGPWVSPWDLPVEADAFHDALGNPVIFVDWHNGHYLACLEPNAKLVVEARNSLKELIEIAKAAESLDYWIRKSPEYIKHGAKLRDALSKFSKVKKRRRS